MINVIQKETIYISGTTISWGGILDKNLSVFVSCLGNCKNAHVEIALLSQTKHKSKTLSANTYILYITLSGNKYGLSGMLHSNMCPFL